MAEQELFQNRISHYAEVPASEILPNPKNWRKHPAAQKRAMLGMLKQIGYADALLVRETPAGLMLIDGHLRKEVSPDQLVPVLVLNVTEEEADILLAGADPLAGMALADPSKLEELMQSITVSDAALREYFDNEVMAKYMQDTEVDDSEGEGSGWTNADANREWAGMPEYNNDDQTSFQRIVVHFNNAEDVQMFARLIGQVLTESTRSIWFPPVEKKAAAHLRYANDAERT